MLSLNIKTLNECPNLVKQTSEIYLQEWWWHYAEEWNINNLDEMIKDVKDNYLDKTFVAFIDDGSGGEVFVGTIAVLDADLKSHMHIGPWVTCLYVVPAYRRRGIARQLMEYVLLKEQVCYLWCYDEKERDLYEQWNFRVIEDILYDNEPAWIMKYDSSHMG